MTKFDHVSTEDLEAELQHRKDHPEWFIRELVQDGHSEAMQTPEFEQATAWMEDAGRKGDDGTYY